MGETEEADNVSFSPTFNYTGKQRTMESWVKDKKRKIEIKIIKLPEPPETHKKEYRI